MKIERTKNTSRNLVFGTLLKVYQLLLPFAFRTVIIYTLGIQYLGLNSLFSSILQVLNLAELGVGGAMVFSMYRPIADDDAVTICALMRLYRRYYRIIGSVVLLLGLAVIPVLPILVKDELPADVNIYALYLLNLSATVVSYWLFAYKNSILQAHQRQDVASKVNLATETVKYALQAGALVLFHNYYYFLICAFGVQILNNIITAIISDRLFPDYHPKGKLKAEEIQKINHRIRDLFTSKLGGTIVNSADTIVISAFLGLEMLAIYQNYYFVMNAVMGFILILYNSITAGIGNSMCTKSREENYRDFTTFSFAEFWILGVCVCCFSALYQNFMTLWMGEALLLPYAIVALLCVYFFGYELVMFLSVYKDAAGIWHEDRYRPLLSGLCNLGLNLVLVQIIGIYGIVLSTVISVFLVSAPWIIKNVMALVFHKSAKVYFITAARYSVVILLAACVNGVLCAAVPGRGMLSLLARGAICCVIPNGIFYLAYRKKSEFHDALRIVKRMLPGKLARVVQKLEQKSS